MKFRSNYFKLVFSLVVFLLGGVSAESFNEINPKIRLMPFEKGKFFKGAYRLKSYYDMSEKEVEALYSQSWKDKKYATEGASRWGVVLGYSFYDFSTDSLNLILNPNELLVVERAKARFLWSSMYWGFRSLTALEYRNDKSVFLEQSYSKSLEEWYLSVHLGWDSRSLLGFNYLKERVRELDGRLSAFYTPSSQWHFYASSGFQNAYGASERLQIESYDGVMGADYYLVGNNKGEGHLHRNSKSLGRVYLNQGLGLGAAFVPNYYNHFLYNQVRGRMFLNIVQNEGWGFGVEGSPVWELYEENDFIPSRYRTQAYLNAILGSWSYYLSMEYESDGNSKKPKANIQTVRGFSLGFEVQSYF